MANERQDESTTEPGMSGQEDEVRKPDLCSPPDRPDRGGSDHGLQGRTRWSWLTPARGWHNPVHFGIETEIGIVKWESRPSNPRALSNQEPRPAGGREAQSKQPPEAAHTGARPTDKGGKKCTSQ
jgi:hypothetical protein